MPTIGRINLFEDWLALLGGKLKEDGFANVDAIAADRLDITYFSYRRRLVEPGARLVHESSTLTVPPELRAGYGRTVAEIRSGVDLRPRLSRSMRDPTYQDAMLNDWGVHHLHLGAATESDGFVARTGPVLYVHFPPGHAYLIGVREHGGWAEIEILETILRDWPDVLASRRMVGIHGPKDGANPTSKELLEARKGGVQALLTLSDGHVYAPLGMGIATDRTSIAAVDTAFAWRRRMRTWEDLIRARFLDLCIETIANGITLPETVNLALELRDGKFFVIVLGAPVAWALPDA